MSVDQQLQQFIDMNRAQGKDDESILMELMQMGLKESQAQAALAGRSLDSGGSAEADDGSAFVKAPLGLPIWVFFAAPVALVLPPLFIYLGVEGIGTGVFMTGLVCLIAGGLWMNFAAWHQYMEDHAGMAGASLFMMRGSRIAVYYYLFMHFDKAWKPLSVMVAGGILMGFGWSLAPDGSGEVMKQL